jgi:Trans-aconitate methyltransferase
MPLHAFRSCADLVRLVQCMPQFQRYRRLQEEFGFDPWHVKSPYARRPYKRRVLALIERFAPQTLVEVGCGLGEIVARSKAPQRFGFDREEAVIAAARVLHPGVIFKAGDLGASQAIAAAAGGPIDMLVAVNWPHMLGFEEIEQAVIGLMALVPVQYLLIDTIHPGGKGYAHFHRKADLARLGSVIVTLPGGDGLRDLHMVRLARPVA